MKKYSNLLLAGFLSAFVIACDDDSVPVVGDTEAPVINLTAPTQAELDAGFAAGATVMVTGTVKDNRDLETVTLTITAPGATTPWFTETWVEADGLFNDQTLTLNEAILIPANTPAGAHTLVITAMDDSENVATSPAITINVMEPNARFNVTVPAGTPADAEIFVVGSFTPNGWDSDDTNEAFKLTRNADGTFTGNFVLPEGADQEFKFRIKSDDPANPWKFVEKNDVCDEIANRTATGTADLVEMPFTVVNWANLGDCAP